MARKANSTAPLSEVDQLIKRPYDEQIKLFTDQNPRPGGGSVGRDALPYTLHFEAIYYRFITANEKFRSHDRKFDSEKILSLHK